MKYVNKLILLIIENIKLNNDKIYSSEMNHFTEYPETSQ